MSHGTHRPHGLTELSPDATCRYTHDDGLDSPDLRVREALFFGDAKEMFHSRITAHGQGRRQLNHHRHFLIK